MIAARRLIRQEFDRRLTEKDKTIIEKELAMAHDVVSFLSRNVVQGIYNADRDAYGKSRCFSDKSIRIVSIIDP
jgi:hypothetical protein